MTGEGTPVLDLDDDRVRKFIFARDPDHPVRLLIGEDMEGMVSAVQQAMRLGGPQEEDSTPHIHHLGADIEGISGYERLRKLARRHSFPHAAWVGHASWEDLNQGLLKQCETMGTPPSPSSANGRILCLRLHDSISTVMNGFTRHVVLMLGKQWDGGGAPLTEWDSRIAEVDWQDRTGGKYHMAVSLRRCPLETDAVDFLALLVPSGIREDEIRRRMSGSLEAMFPNTLGVRHQVNEASVRKILEDAFKVDPREVPELATQYLQGEAGAGGEDLPVYLVGGLWGEPGAGIGVRDEAWKAQEWFKTLVSASSTIGITYVVLAHSGSLSNRGQEFFWWLWPKAQLLPTTPDAGKFIDSVDALEKEVRELESWMANQEASRHVVWCLAAVGSPIPETTLSSNLPPLSEFRVTQEDVMRAIVGLKDHGDCLETFSDGRITLRADLQEKMTPRIGGDLRERYRWAFHTNALGGHLTEFALDPSSWTERSHEIRVNFIPRPKEDAEGELGRRVFKIRIVSGRVEGKSFVTHLRAGELEEDPVDPVFVVGFDISTGKYLFGWDENGEHHLALIKEELRKKVDELNGGPVLFPAEVRLPLTQDTWTGLQHQMKVECQSWRPWLISPLTPEQMDELGRLLRETVERVLQFAQKEGLGAFQAMLKDIHAGMAQWGYLVAVTGVNGGGKSTTVQALVEGTEILPVGASDLTTARPIVIRPHDVATPDVTVYDDQDHPSQRLGGSPENIQAILKENVCRDDSRAVPGRYAEVRIPRTWVKWGKDVAVVDLPDVTNDPEAMAREMAHHVLRMSSVILFVITPRDTRCDLGRQELELLRDSLRANPHQQPTDAVILVVNLHKTEMKDGRALYSEHEGTKLEFAPEAQYFENGLSQQLKRADIEKVEVIAVDACRAGEVLRTGASTRDLARTGVPELEDFLKLFLLNKDAYLGTRLRLTIGVLRDSIGVEIRSQDKLRFRLPEKEAEKARLEAEKKRAEQAVRSLPGFVNEMVNEAMDRMKKESRRVQGVFLQDLAISLAREKNPDRVSNEVDGLLGAVLGSVAHDVAIMQRTVNQEVLGVLEGKPWVPGRVAWEDPVEVTPPEGLLSLKQLMLIMAVLTQLKEQRRVWWGLLTAEGRENRAKAYVNKVKDPATEIFRGVERTQEQVIQEAGTAIQEAASNQLDERVKELDNLLHLVEMGIPVDSEQVDRRIDFLEKELAGMEDLLGQMSTRARQVVSLKETGGATETEILDLVAMGNRMNMDTTVFKERLARLRERAGRLPRPMATLPGSILGGIRDDLVTATLAGMGLIVKQVEEKLGQTKELGVSNVESLQGHLARIEESLRLRELKGVEPEIDQLRLEVTAALANELKVNEDWLKGLQSKMGSLDLLKSKYGGDLEGDINKALNQVSTWTKGDPVEGLKETQALRRRIEDSVQQAAREVESELSPLLKEMEADSGKYP